MIVDDISIGNTKLLLVSDTEESVPWQKFTVDEGAIDHFIHAQNGTLPTAIRELVMNAIDAGSQVYHITLTSKRFTVQDLGKGFVDESEIRQKFGHFAQNRDNSDSIYARFRIGRGQCMSLAKMQWRSNIFLIETDIRTRGNAYRVTRDLPSAPGCFIEGELYQPLSDWDLQGVHDELNKMFAFVGIELTINGLPLNKALPDSYWDINNERFCIKFDPKREDGLRLYNLGVYVKELHYHRFGFNADVVSKVPFVLNMARNELHETDKLYPEINAILKARAIEIAKEKQRKQKMDETSRRNLIARFLSSDLPFDEILHFSILRDCRGHYLKLKTLWNNHIPLTIAEEGFERIADRLSVSRIAQVLHSDEARLWGVSSAPELLTLLRSKIPDSREYRYYRNALNKRRTEPFSNLIRGLRSHHTLLKSSQLDKRERATLNALTYLSSVMSKRLNACRYEDMPEVSVRKVLPGDSDTAQAWTDGSSMIAINRTLLTLPEKGLWGVYQLCHIMLHEYCHNDPNFDGHGHDSVFLQRFHDAALSDIGAHEIMGHCITSFISRYRAQCIQNDLPLHVELQTSEVRQTTLLYDLFFADHRSLSAFSCRLLEQAGFVIEKRGACWRLRLNTHKFCEGGSRHGIKKYLNALLAEHQLELIPDFDDPDAPPEYERSAPGVPYLEQPIILWMKKTRVKRLSLLCEKLALYEGYAKILDPEYISQTYSYQHPARFAESLLSVICADPSNGACRFETNFESRRTRLGTAHAVLDLSSNEAYVAGLYRHNRKSNPETPLEVQRTVLNQMQTCINGIADPALRADFIARFISKELLLAMGVEE